MKNKSAKGLLVSMIILAIAGIGLNYLAYSAVKKANVKVFELENEAAAFEKTKSELFGKGDGGILASVEKINSYVLEKDGVVPFIEKMESDGRSLGASIKISSVTIDVPVETDALPESLEKLRIMFEADGSWSSLSHLVFYIEHIPYQLKIEKISLTRIVEVGTAGGSLGKEVNERKTNVTSWKLRTEMTVIKEK